MSHFNSEINLRGLSLGSYQTHEFTWALKTPLNFAAKTAFSVIYPLKGSICYGVIDVAKRIFKLIAILVLLLPACLLYGLGAISSAIFATPKIDLDSLHLAPYFVYPEAKPEVKIDILKVWFDDIPRLPNRDKFYKMIDDIDTQSKQLLTRWRLPPEFHEDMRAYLQNIIALLNENSSKRLEVLRELADASTACPPTWFEVARRCYRQLANPTHGESQLLAWVQEVKEEMIKYFGQAIFDNQWHALNYVRYHAGTELGLETEGLENDQNFSREQDSYFTKNFIIRMVKTHLHPDNFISALQTKINTCYDPAFPDILILEMKNRGMPQSEATNFVYENFFDDRGMINRNGVITLLKIISVLK